MDAKHHWLHRPCLLMLKDGDVTKPGQLGCGHIGSDSPAKPKVHSEGVLSPGVAPVSQLETPAQRLMRQLEEGNCTVTTLSTWGERNFGEASTPLMLSPSKAAGPEVEVEVEEEVKNKPQPASSKEDSVVEEKELEESGLELQDPPSGSDALGPYIDDPSGPPVEEPYGGGHDAQIQGPRLGLQSQTKANGLANDETNANRVQADSEEGAVGDCTPSPMSPLVDPDNELQAGPAGILSRERGTILGEVAPVWVPDAQALVCMMCEVRFTFTKRRHHCRACGKVFCSVCSGLKFRLTHLDGKEGRVCVSCHSTLVKREYHMTTLVLLLNPSSPFSGLPPILTSTGVKGGTTRLLSLEMLTANSVRDVNRKCWCVTSKGMHAVGQVEVVVLLQCLPEEKSFPKDIFSHFIQLYRDALTGKVLSHLGLSQFSSSFLSSEEHAGFLWVRSTLQSLQGLPMPNQPFLFGLLVHRAEVPWAKAFPLRLMLRLGAEYRFYPCPLYSVRFRKALFGETGHTIMRLLVDFRNYRYTLPVVPGLTVDLEAQRTCIKIPTNGYEELMRALNKSNEHVLAMGACFNVAADSHLICVQGDDGQYQTQAISIHNQPRKVTGSCFFVFSGALKAASGYLAKSSIVEDGLMVQITVETMVELRRSLREMKDYTITCGSIDQSDSQEHVQVQWLDKECTLNKGVISPIDGKSMESVNSVKMFQKSEYKSNGKVIRWTEVFFVQRGDRPKSQGDHHTEHSRLTERLARAFCLALCPHLKLLKEDGMAKLGLRVTLDSQQVGFVAGSNGLPLPAPYLSTLDTVLTPIIHSRGRKRSEGPVVIELIFYILENIS
uniref:Zinc finger, FYVE domain containing 9b n=1 Tax=Oncorhynchus kisutch TaxID=8019 RepID=A0A8C7DZ11_ONCKI